MERQADGLVGHGNLGLVRQIRGQPTRSPIGTGDTDRLWVELDDPQEFGLPLGRHRGSYARGFVRWEGSDTTTQKAGEDALDGIAAAENNGGNGGHRAPLMGQQVICARSRSFASGAVS